MPTTGEYRLAGNDVAHLDENRLAEVRNRHIGFVFQQFNLLAVRSTALAQRGAPARLRRPRPAERQRRALAALDQVGLGEPGRPPTGGALRRPAAARRDRPGAGDRAALILADEPTGNLDSASTTEVLDLLSDLHRTGRTIVLITHEPDVAARAGAHDPDP